MDIKNFMKTFNKSEREAFAKKAGTSNAYLHQLAGGHRVPSAMLCKKLEIATDGLLTRAELRPDLFC